MLEKSFLAVYNKFKMHFYQQVFSNFQDREASLTAVETFCMEIILALKEPTINEFSTFVNISSPNAAYRVNSLMQKGYVEKIQSESDRREYHLRPTQKYMDYYNISSQYLGNVMDRIKREFSEEEVKALDRMLGIIGSELMPEVQLKD